MIGVAAIFRMTKVEIAQLAIMDGKVDALFDDIDDAIGHDGFDRDFRIAREELR